MLGFALQQVKTKHRSDITQASNVWPMKTLDPDCLGPKFSDDFACVGVCIEFRFSFESSLLFTLVLSSPVKARLYRKVVNASSGENFSNRKEKVCSVLPIHINKSEAWALSQLVCVSLSNLSRNSKARE